MAHYSLEGHLSFLVLIGASYAWELENWLTISFYIACYIETLTQDFSLAKMDWVLLGSICDMMTILLRGLGNSIKG